MNIVLLVVYKYFSLIIHIGHYSLFSAERWRVGERSSFSSAARLLFVLQEKEKDKEQEQEQ